MIVTGLQVDNTRILVAVGPADYFLAIRVIRGEEYLNLRVDFITRVGLIDQVEITKPLRYRMS